MSAQDWLEPHDLPSERVALPGYLLRIRQGEPTQFGNVLQCDFDLVQQFVRGGVICYPTDEHHQAKDRTAGPETDNIEQAELAAAGFVKWDGCTQFAIGQVHVDDRLELEELLAAIAEARRRCAKRLGRDIADEYDDIPWTP